MQWNQNIHRICQCGEGETIPCESVHVYCVCVFTTSKYVNQKAFTEKML